MTSVADVIADVQRVDQCVMDARRVKVKVKQLKRYSRRFRLDIELLAQVIKRRVVMGRSILPSL